MSAKKQRDKNRRRASKLAQQAWNAAEAGNLHLAVKVLGRAAQLQPANPVLWHDLGTLLLRLDEEDEAARSFEAAIQVAPDFAEAYASLAAIRARQGIAEQAVTLQREAVRHAPNVPRHQDALAAYEALFIGWSTDARPSLETRADSRGDRPPPDDGLSTLAASIEGLNWGELDASLTRRGVACVPRLLDAAQCEALRAMFDEARLFAKSVTMNKPHFGKGVYRYFAAPIPLLVAAIRRLVYPHAAQIANRWQRLLGDHDLYPAAWSAFQSRCAEAGQTTPSPLLLRYEAGGFNAPHQDLRGDVFFPLQLVIVLSPRAASAHDNDSDGFAGGEFLLCDQPERKSFDRREIAAGLGDAILFCTRARLVRVGDVYGLKPVMHGLNPITSGIRYAIGIPFHDFT